MRCGSICGPFFKGDPLTDVQEQKGRWVYRRSVPLSNFKPQCALCHGAFQGLQPSDWVGALMLTIPIAGK